ncbi:acyltransferase family protein [Janibacter corallicola]|uniref:acyltransferase family protein n=1 Tax=Janibacter corallicola TaxID=415212 RepID=UPI00082DF67D|nr:acyltransferase family protein [Janibacter corallicola]
MSESPVPRGYRPPLDGLRGISVIAIVLFHAGATWVAGGYWAVNVFFIVSGYLITGLLLAEYDRWGTIDLVKFYVRRARRLLPALVTTVALTAVATRFLLGTSMPETSKGDAISSLFYVANWRFILTGQSYFAEFGSASPFRHMWTLAIEEQYYLIFPTLLLVLLTWLRRKWHVTWGLVVLIGASATLMFLLRPEPGADTSRIYYGTDTRMQDIFSGCALALAVWAARTRDLARLASRRRLLDVVGVIGAVGLIAALLLLQLFHWVYPWGYLLFNTGFVVLVLGVVEIAPGGLLARVMSVGPLVWVGKLSYSLYLVHWPVIVLLDESVTGLDGMALFALRMAISFPLAAGSYYFIENPVRRGRLSTLLTPSRTGLVGVTAMALGVACVLTSFQGIKGTPNVATGDAQRVSADAGSGDFPLLIVGDSVGFSLGYNFPKEDFPDVAPTAQVRFGCGTAIQHLAVDGHQQEPGTEKCEGMFQEWTTAAEETRPKAVVWSLGGWEVFDHVVDGKIVSPGSPGYTEHLESRLEEGLAALPEDVPVFIPDVPCYHQESFVVDGEDLAPDRNDTSRSKAVNRVLEDFAKKHDRVHVPDTYSYLCPNGSYEKRIDGVWMRDDGVHYSAEGAHEFWSWLMPQINETVKREGGR